MRRFGELLLCCLLGVTSCVSLESRTKSALVGDWHYRDEVQSCRYRFRSDGQFSGEVSNKGRLVSKFTGRWSVEGMELLYVYAGDELGQIPAGATDRDRLLEVGKNSFLIQAADGNRRRYERGP